MIIIVNKDFISNFIKKSDALIVIPINLQISYVLRKKWSVSFDDNYRYFCLSTNDLMCVNISKKCKKILFFSHRICYILSTPMIKCKYFYKCKDPFAININNYTYYFIIYFTRFILY